MFLMNIINLGEDLLRNKWDERRDGLGYLLYNFVAMSTFCWQ